MTTTEKIDKQTLAATLQGLVLEQVKQEKRTKELAHEVDQAAERLLRNQEQLKNAREQLRAYAQENDDVPVRVFQLPDSFGSKGWCAVLRRGATKHDPITVEVVNAYGAL